MSIRRSFAKIVKAEILARSPRVGANCNVSQELLQKRIRQTASDDPESLAIPNISVFSEHEEDGILLFIFSLIGDATRRCVELGSGDAMECNTTNLLVHWGWTGLLVDADGVNIRAARRFFKKCRRTRAWPPSLVADWLTKSNVNEVLEENGITGTVDLLSIDIDGMDYWIWEAVEVVQPRVVVIEINHLWGDDRAVTVPYSEHFQAVHTAYGTDYAGASLPAMVRLGRRKGYRLVATNRIATNAFFVLDTIKECHLPELDPASCFEHPRARFGRSHRLPGIRDKIWEAVEP